MLSVLSFLYLPFLAGLILTGIHVWLGVQILERRVVFVDLSLAQLAALGAGVAVVVFHLHGPATHLVSLCFAIAGAAFFAFVPPRRDTRLPLEVLAAIVYSVAAAAATMVIGRSAGDSDRLREMLIGNILSVSAGTLFRTAVLYGVVGSFLFMYRRQFDALSQAMHEEMDVTPRMRLWNFLFYASLGVVVSWSVAIAGVLVVFSYLTIPAAAAMLVSTRPGVRLAIGWSMGTLVSVLGILLSFKLDLPTGGTVICTLAVALAIVAAIGRIGGRRVSGRPITGVRPRKEIL